MQLSSGSILLRFNVAASEHHKALSPLDAVLSLEKKILSGTFVFPYNYTEYPVVPVCAIAIVIISLILIFAGLIFVSFFRYRKHDNIYIAFVVNILAGATDPDIDTSQCEHYCRE